MKNTDRATKDGGGRPENLTFAMLAVADAINNMASVLERGLQEIRDRLPKPAEQPHKD